ncbi:hypothetical protein HanRHA438_Chr10g0471201 [Helianthus annuus]|nr:hypothetical protein HanRHA438_Chr10g0471191 [Helianthus annuus]KAJ0881150.1 hypothetical protein HanRHA438_Chr10g0471201 [Helianthus annuus]
MYCKTWVYPCVYYYENVVVYSDKIFPNYGPDENFRCQIRPYTIPPKLAHGRLFLRDRGL